MKRVIIFMFTVFIVSPVVAAEPLIDDHQLKAVEAHEKINRECDEETDKDKKIKCLFYLSQGDNQWPLPFRGTDRYCKEQYASLSVSELESKFKEIESIYEHARYFPIGSALQPERGEITKGDLNSEIQCISDYIHLKK